MFSVCGIDCKSCHDFLSNCNGCRAMQGKIYWTKQVGFSCSPIYQCVKDNKMSDCGECNRLPCDVWMSLNDPSLTEQEPQKSIDNRIAALKSKQ